MLDVITQYNINITTKHKRPTMTISEIVNDSESVSSKKTISDSFKGFFGIQETL